MTRRKTEAAVATAPEAAVLDHFTPGEPGVYSHEEARARAAAYVPPDPPAEADQPTEAPDAPGPSDSPAGPDVKE